MYVNENITHGNIQPKLLPEQQSSSNTLCFLPTESGEWVGGTYKHINIILFGQGGGWGGGRIHIFLFNVREQ